MKNKSFLFCQFSTLLINKGNKKDIADKYYANIYKKKSYFGYYKNTHFWELPLWIAEICGTLKNHKKELLIIKEVKQALKKLNKVNTDFILFSVLEVNKHLVMKIIKNYTGNATFILGGYIDFKDFKKFDNVLICSSPQDMTQKLNIDYVYNLDYLLFKNYKTVPRLTLSTGCTNKCKFCTVEKKIVSYNLQDIKKQIESFQYLKFKLIYLNDKTFSQAKNYKQLANIYNDIKKYNKKFKGFIIQTTTAQFLNAEFIQTLKNSHVQVVELGIESYNNNLLKELKKPQNIDTIDNAIQILKNLKIKIIPNFIIGLIGENESSYNNTLNFIKKHIKDFFILNIYNLAIYKNTELSQEINNLTDNDFNELIQEKSFYNDNQSKINEVFYNDIFKLGLQIL